MADHTDISKPSSADDVDHMARLGWVDPGSGGEGGSLPLLTDPPKLVIRAERV